MDEVVGQSVFRIKCTGCLLVGKEQAEAVRHSGPSPSPTVGVHIIVVLALNFMPVAVPSEVGFMEWRGKGQAFQRRGGHEFESSGMGVKDALIVRPQPDALLAVLIDGVDIGLQVSAFCGL